MSIQEYVNPWSRENFDKKHYCNIYLKRVLTLARGYIILIFQIKNEHVFAGFLAVMLVMIMINYYNLYFSDMLYGITQSRDHQQSI